MPRSFADELLARGQIDGLGMDGDCDTAEKKRRDDQSRLDTHANTLANEAGVELYNRMIHPVIDKYPKPGYRVMSPRNEAQKTERA